MLSTTHSHHWSSPAEIAAHLDARPHGQAWRARCPAHGGDNPTSLSIAEGRAKDGTPMTLLYCHAHQCSVADICAALGIPLTGLWCLRPDAPPRPRGYARPALPPRAFGDHTAYTPDDLAEAMLSAMVVSDPSWFATCPGARETCWRLGQEPARKYRLSAAMAAAGMRVLDCWATLASEAYHGPTA